MVVYNVHWSVEGHSKFEDGLVCFTVLCRNIKDAVKCLDSYFRYVYKGKFNIDDGRASFTRVKVDSRGFNPNYIYLDDIECPLSLSNFKNSLRDYLIRNRIAL